MSKKTPSPPPAPDPVKTAAAQTATNVETAKAQAALNRLNQITPYGTVTYSPTGAKDLATGLPQYQQTTRLTPEAQRSLEQQQALGSQLTGLAGRQFGRVEDVLSTPFSYEGIPQIPGQEDLLAERRRVEEGLFSGAMERLDPRFQREEERLRTQLANQGIVQGSEAFGTELSGLGERQSDLINQALQSAIQTGGAEQARMFGLGQVARQQGIQEETFLRNLPLNEISALLSGQQIQGPQAAPIAQVGLNPADIMGATYQSQQIGANQAYQAAAARNAPFNNLMALGGQLGAAALMAPVASSKTFKDTIGHENNILVKIDKLDIDRWSYKENLVGVPKGEHIGPYAEDFNELFGVGEGKTINAVDAIGVCLGAIKELSAKVKELEAHNA